ncbi:MAG TPA: SDR family NAD(P)-dependent oxidoreductase, partial [Sphingobacteriaceae bacterium]
MASILITGSADGLGHLAAKALIARGHRVVLHARNEERGREALKKAPGAETVITGDLADPDEIIQLSKKVNASGTFDAVIHNAGVYIAPARELFAVNTLAPYILTCLISKPRRIIYLSSGMHQGGSFREESFERASPLISYSDTKLHVLMLCKAVAGKWPEVYANAVDPGWVPTKMGGRGAPDDLEKGYLTQVWLAEGQDEAAKVSGRYFFHQKQRPSNPE